MWQQIDSNKRNSLILITVIAMIMFSVGYVLGEFFQSGDGILGVGIAAVIWIFMCITGFFFGGNIVLAFNNAKKIGPDDHKLLYNVVEEMKIASGLERMPDIYIINSPVPNAFATGRSPAKSAVAVTTKLLTLLNREELQGVIAHEISHIINRDTLYLTMAGIMIGVISLLADISLNGVLDIVGDAPVERTSSKDENSVVTIIFYVAGIILMLIAPLLGRLLYFAISRKREYLADACAVQFTRYPQGLAKALEKLAIGNYNIPRSFDKITSAMCIVNPLETTGKKKIFPDLLSSHPPIQDRIKILRSMLNGDLSSYDSAYSQVTKQDLNIETTPVSPVNIIQNAVQNQFSAVDNMRQTTNMIWAMNNYIFIECDCGTKLKIPPEYTDIEINCPHCSKAHYVS